MQANDLVRLRHMLDSAREALAFSQGKSRQELEHDRLLQLGLVRLIEVVGEAANQVSSETQILYPSIPWKQVIGMRHRLIHGYDVIDLDILYSTVREDLPVLIEALETIVVPDP